MMKKVKVMMVFAMITPRKINMEPTNTPLEEENHLNQTIIFRFYVNLQGCMVASPGVAVFVE